MSNRKQALTLAFSLGMLVGGAAWAVCSPPHRDPRDCTPSKPEPARPIQVTPDPADRLPLAKKPLSRRSVQQVIGRMPESPPPPAVYGYRPTTVPGAAAPSALPTGPLPVNTCDPGGCRDASGTLHYGGVGSATIDANGRLCSQNGAWLVCH